MNNMAAVRKSSFSSALTQITGDRKVISATHIYIAHRAVPYVRRLAAGFPPQRSGFELGSGHVRFVATKRHLGRFPCRPSFHQLLHNHPHISGAGTMGPSVTTVPSELSLTPLRIIKECTVYETLSTIVKHADDDKHLDL
jgi:hypothetical protein